MVSERPKTESGYALGENLIVHLDGSVSCSWLCDVFILFEFLDRFPLVSLSLLRSSSWGSCRVVQGEAGVFTQSTQCLVRDRRTQTAWFQDVVRDRVGLDSATCTRSPLSRTVSAVGHGS